MGEEITEKQAEAMLRNFAKSSHNHHTFLRDAVANKDTTRLGNLDMEELGNPSLELRGLKDLQTFCEEVYQDKGWSTLFKEMGQNITATSLSKDGFLMNLSVMNKQEMADTTTKERKKNKGWFRKKD